MKTTKTTTWQADRIIATEDGAFLSNGVMSHPIEHEDVFKIMKALPAIVTTEEHITGSLSKTTITPSWKKVEKLIIKVVYDEGEN